MVHTFPDFLVMYMLGHTHISDMISSIFLLKVSSEISERCHNFLIGILALDPVYVVHPILSQK